MTATPDDRYLSVLHRSFRRAVEDVLEGRCAVVPPSLIRSFATIVEGTGVLPDGRTVPVSEGLQVEALDTWTWAVSNLPSLLDC